MRLVHGTGSEPRRYSARSFFKTWRQVLSLAEHCRRERRWQSRQGVRHQLSLHAREAERKMYESVDPHELLRLRLGYGLTEPQQRILATVALAPATGYSGEFLLWMAYLGQEEAPLDNPGDCLSMLIQRQLVAVARGESQARIWKIRYVPGPMLDKCVEAALDRRSASPVEGIVFLDDVEG